MFSVGKIRFYYSQVPPLVMKIFELYQTVPDAMMKIYS